MESMDIKNRLVTGDFFMAAEWQRAAFCAHWESDLLWQK